MKSFRSFNEEVAEATSPINKINHFLQKKKDREAHGARLYKEREAREAEQKKNSQTVVKNEAKDKKASFDLNDQDLVDYKPGEDKFSKRNANKRRKANEGYSKREVKILKQIASRQRVKDRWSAATYSAQKTKKPKLKEDNTFSSLSSKDLAKRLERHTSSSKRTSNRPNSAMHIHHTGMAKRAQTEVDYRKENLDELSSNTESFIEDFIQRPQLSDRGTHIEVFPEGEQLDEILNVAQRRKRGIIARRNKAKMQRGRKKQSRRIADRGRLANRARRQAKRMMTKKLTRGISKANLSPQRKAEIERRLKRMDSRIGRIQKRILPQVRKRDRG